MIGIDTNVLIRYVTQDDAGQAAKVDALLDEARKQGRRIYLNKIVLVETVWVLLSLYQYSKSEVIALLEAVLVTQQFEFDDKDAVRQAIAAYRAGKGDFADYLICLGNQLAHCDCTATFDRNLAKTDGVRLL